MFSIWAFQSVAEYKNLWNNNADAMLYLPGGGAMLFFN